MNTKTDKEYFTKDLAEASFLIVKGKLLYRIERKGRICWFIFLDKQECEQLANEYWFRNSSVIAKSFYEAIQTLKNRIFSER